MEVETFVEGCVKGWASHSRGSAARPNSFAAAPARDQAEVEGCAARRMHPQPGTGTVVGGR